MSLAIRSIELYQRHLLPHKGFCCAYRVAHNDLSCSEFVKQQIAAKGLLKSLAGIRQRFSDCKQAARQLSERKKESHGKDKDNDKLIDRYCCCDLATCVPAPPGGSAAGAGAGGCDGCACTPF